MGFLLCNLKADFCLAVTASPPAGSTKASVAVSRSVVFCPCCAAPWGCLSCSLGSEVCESAGSPADTRACVLHWKALWALQVVENLWLSGEMPSACCVARTHPQCRTDPTSPWVTHQCIFTSKAHPGQADSLLFCPVHWAPLPFEPRPSPQALRGGGGWLSCLLLCLPACPPPHLEMLLFQASPAVLAIELPAQTVTETPRCGFPGSWSLR